MAKAKLGRRRCSWGDSENTDGVFANRKKRGAIVGRDARGSGVAPEARPSGPASAVFQATAVVTKSGAVVPKSSGSCSLAGFYKAPVNSDFHPVPACSGAGSLAGKSKLFGEKLQRVRKECMVEQRLQACQIVGSVQGLPEFLGDMSMFDAKCPQNRLACGFPCALL